MEAIRAANLLTNNDAHGGAWIAFNKPQDRGTRPQEAVVAVAADAAARNQKTIS